MGRVVIPGFRKIETSGGGEGGTTNYNDLTNKPSINNVPLVGNLNTVNLKLTDATLTEEGVPAEAKTVGQKLEEQSTSLTALSGQLGNHTVKSDVPENAVFTDTVYDDTEVKGEVAGINSNLDTLCKTNLIDKSVRYDGYYANDNKYYNDVSGFYIYIIKVVPNTDIIMSGFSSQGAFCAYLNSQNVEDVKQSAWNIEDNNGTHTIPSDVHYVGICCNTADASADIKAIGFVECANEINDINESLSDYLGIELAKENIVLAPNSYAKIGNLSYSKGNTFDCFIETDSSTSETEFLFTNEVDTPISDAFNVRDFANGKFVTFNVTQNASVIKIFANGPATFSKLTIFNRNGIQGELTQVNSNLDTLQFGEVAGGKNLLKVNTNYWTLTDNGIKNNGKNEGIILGNVKLIAGKTYKIYLLLKSKPTSDSSFAANINGNDISSISFVKINEFNLNEKIEYNYTPTSDCEVLYILWGNSNSDIFEFQFQVEEGSVATDYEQYIPSVKMLAEDVDSIKNDLDKLNALPIGTIIQIEADKDTIATTEAKYSWQYLGTSNIQYENGGAYILVANVYRKNN